MYHLELIDKQISKNLQSLSLLNHNIFIKQLSNIGLKGSNYFRVALVSKPQIEKLIKALERFSDKEIFFYITMNSFLGKKF